MTFPVLIPLGPVAVHPHPLFEGLGYFVGFRLYLWQRRRRGDFLGVEQRWTVVVAAVVGAAIGSKLLYWLENPARTWLHATDLAYLMAGKSVVGGLLGGWLVVEWAKRRAGITRRTGDLFAVPLALGMALGRVGCFLTGLPDLTHGLQTRLPWAVDFGDGPRHPTQLYEIAFLLLLAGWLKTIARRPRTEGHLFRLFLAGYLAFRLAVEWLKPGLPLFGLTAIQWACVLGLGWLARDAWVDRRREELALG